MTTSPATPNKSANPSGQNSSIKVIEVPPMANEATLSVRHVGILISFFVAVVMPILGAAFYLYLFAADQYESRVAFVVRTEESRSALEMLSGLSGISRASSSDTDILYEFIQSQEMVLRIDEQMNLHDLFSGHDVDPLFSLSPNASLEEMVEYWSRMVRVYYDGGTGLIEVRSYAFSANDAHELSQRIFTEASQMINALSDVAREDATRYAKEELNKAIERLISARQAMTAFRIETQIVDPSADIAGQMGVLNTLQARLAEVLIEQDLLKQTAHGSDPRIEQLGRRIQVIEERIAAERQKLGVGSAASSDAASGGFAKMIGEFERLQVDQEFAETSYVTALGAYDAALSEAQRKSRYLAAYLRPTKAETSTAPRRSLWIALVGGFAFMIWSVGILAYYSVRDRR